MKKKNIKGIAFSYLFLEIVIFVLSLIGEKGNNNFILSLSKFLKAFLSFPGSVLSILTYIFSWLNIVFLILSIIIVVKSIYDLFNDGLEI